MFPLALSVLAALDFTQNSDTLKFNKLSVYTLGQPRIGNDIFVDYVDKTLVCLHINIKLFFFPNTLTCIYSN